MAVIDIKERREDRTADEVDGKPQSTASYLVITDSASDGPSAALYADMGTGGLAIPAAGEVDPDNGLLVCTNKTAKPSGNSGRHWIVTVTYKPVSHRIDKSAKPPLERPIEYSRNYRTWQEPYFRDASGTSEGDGLPVVNTAGEPFDNKPERQKGAMVIVIVRNEADDNASSDDGYSNSVNSAQITICGVTYGAEMCRMLPIQSKMMFEIVGQTEYLYHQKTYEIEIKTPNWDDEIPSYGFNWLDDDGQLYEIWSGGKRVTKQWPLDAEGLPMANAGDSPANVVRKPYKVVDWSGLQLPSTLPTVNEF